MRCSNEQNCREKERKNRIWPNESQHLKRVKITKLIYILRNVVDESMTNKVKDVVNEVARTAQL
jgi:hypothetical protein